MMNSDLVLESRDEKSVKVILPNIKGQKYVLDPFYPGERKGEEFIFIRNDEGPTGPTHGVIISVDEQGQYWIQNDTRIAEGMTTRSCVYNTFVNNERVKAVELRLLKSGDMISFGNPETRTVHGGHRQGHPVFCVKERIIGGNESSLQLNNANEPCNSVSFADSPLANNLILSEIMTYLPVKDLKNARQVCKKWGDEATKALEKRGKVSFPFGDYANPENSLRVFRYLHEMGNLKMRNIQISLGRINFDEDTEWYNAPGLESQRLEALQKMVDDLRKLLKSSHNFSSLILQAEVRDEAEFRPFSTIFQELGGKLVELELTLDGYVKFFPKQVPQLPLLPNLKKFTQSGSKSELGYYDNDDVLNKWASLLVPLFANNLEQFICKDDEEMVEPYLQAFLAQDMPNLRGIAIESFERKDICEDGLSLLLSLKTPLKSLKFAYGLWSEEGARVLEKVLLKHSSSLQILKISLMNFLKNPEVRFPTFPKLGELKLEYDMRPRIGWETDLDYEKHFPSLRKLTVKPGSKWRNDDQVFNAFFPEKGELRSETVTEVSVPVLRNPERPSYWPCVSEVDFQPRMDQIRKMFPNAESINFFR